MAIDFPSSPTNGQTYVYNGITFVYNSTSGLWNVLSPATAVFGPGTKLSSNVTIGTGPTPVQTLGNNSPPGSPVTGACYVVGTSGSGGWAGQSNNIAYYTGSAWIFFTPDTEWRVRNIADGLDYRWTGSAWRQLRGRVTLRKSASQSIPNLTWTKVTGWDVEVIDDCGGHSGTDSFITAPSWATTFRCGALVDYSPWNAGSSGNFASIFPDGGTPVTPTGQLIAGNMCHQAFGNRKINIVSAWLPCTGGSTYIDLWVYQDSGGARDVLGPVLDGYGRTTFWAEFE